MTPKPQDRQRRKLRRLMMLVSLFAFLPSALLLTVGVLILVFGHATKDLVFGVITLGLTVTFPETRCPKRAAGDRTLLTSVTPKPWRSPS